jgi:hypothetical protein
MAAIAEQPAPRPPRPATRRRRLTLVRGEAHPPRPREGITIHATRAAVFDVLVDRAARDRWLGVPAVVEQASLHVHAAPVRTNGALPFAQARSEPVSYVSMRARRPDGAVVSLGFVLHARPGATEVELRHRILSPSSPRHRPGAGWLASHWRRRALDALRREVEQRAPKEREPTRRGRVRQRGLFAR